MSVGLLALLGGVWLLGYLFVTWRERRHDRASGWREARRDWLAVGALAAATVGFFWRQIFTDKAWTPAGGGDLASFIYPMLQFTARHLKAGELPLWNPYLYGGAPFAADIQAMILYPVNWLFLLLSPEVTYRLVEHLSFFHFFLAGVSMYLCLRYLDWAPNHGQKRDSLRLWAAATGALAYMFGDVMLVHLGNLNIIAVAAWLPLVFLFLQRALSRRSIGQAAIAGVFLAVAFLAGHIQIFLYILVLLIAYTIYWALTVRPRAVTHHGALLLLTLAVGVALSAPVLLPAAEMTQFTRRADLDYRESSAYSLPPAKLIGLFVPSFFERDPSLHWGPWDRVEVGYVGIFTLLLALLAVLLRRGRLNLFFVLLSVGALFLALGEYGIVHGWFYQFAPLFDRLRAPARAALLMDFGLAALAAQGLDALLRPLSRPQRAVWRGFLRLAPWVLLGAVLLSGPLAYYALFMGQEKDPVIFLRIARGVNGVVLFLVFLSLSFLWLALRRWRWARPGALGSLAALLVLLDLAGTGAYLDIARRPPTKGFDHPAIIAFLKQDAELFRIDSRTDIWHLWQPDTPLLHDIADVWGVVNPLTLADYDRYWENMGSRSSPLYDFLNAKYVIAAKDVVLDWEKFTLAFDGDPDLNVYLNRNVLPRTFAVHHAIVAPDQQAAFDAIHAPDFDPAVQVVVEGGPPLSGPDEAAEPGRVQVMHYGLNRIELEADMPAAGYVVLSEVYYPGWEVQIDGATALLYRANYAFRAVYVDAGTRRIILRFRPVLWRVGLAVAGVAPAALVAFFVAKSVVKIKKKNPTGLP